MHTCLLPASVVILGLAATSAFAAPETKTIPIADFTAIETTDVAVSLQVGPSTSLIVTGDPAELARLEVIVKNGELRLRPKQTRRFFGFWSDSLKNVSARITTPRLQRAAISGDGDMVVKGINSKSFDVDISGAGRFTSADARADKLDVSISGSGDVILSKARADIFDISISGSGNVTLDGACKTADIGISGSGTIRTRALQCSTVEIGIAGSGDVEAFASQSADTRISGGGDVLIYGNPAQRNKRILGGGSVSYPAN
jgi:hypothetical protein